MNSFSDAFVKHGLAPRIVDRDYKFGERSAIHFRDPKSMSDNEIIEEYEKESLQSVDIERQLEDDLVSGIVKGEIWRHKAKSARRAKQLRCDQLRLEAKKRGLVAIDPEKARLLAEKLAQEEKDRKEKEERQIAHAKFVAEGTERKNERMRIANERNKAACELFVEAAKMLHSRDSVIRIWERARRMFPDHDAWKTDLKG